jgi:hypothetical protein
VPGSVHPDVLYFSQGLDGYKFWLFFTPAPERNSVPWDPSVTPDWYWERPTLLRSNDGVNWQKTADYTNPLIAPGAPGTWDSSWLADPDIVYAPGKGPKGESWFMYYVGINAPDSHVGVALSNDGKHFTKFAQNPIMPSYTRCPTVVYEPATGQFKAWYNWGMYQVGLATSTDGLHWQPYNPTQPGQWGYIVLSGTPGTYDQGGISHMDVIKQGNQYWMYYLGMPTSDYANLVIGRAVSSDGIFWTKDTAPVLTPGINGVWNFWENSPRPVLSLYRPAAVVVDDAMYLYFGGIDTAQGIPAPSNYDSGLAFSTRYSDVSPFYWAYHEIDAVGAAGITAGCGNHNYCPEQSAKRKEVAVFIIAGMGEQGSGHPYNTYFDDVANDGFAPSINRMYELGITAGCGYRRFCPETYALRKEVAVFLVGALHESGSPVPYNTYFDDIANDAYAPSINRILELGITSGCATRRFCPSDQASRAAMAVFDAEAFLW